MICRSKLSSLRVERPRQKQSDQKLVDSLKQKAIVTLLAERTPASFAKAKVKVHTDHAGKSRRAAAVYPARNEKRLTCQASSGVGYHWLSPTGSACWSSLASLRLTSPFERARPEAISKKSG